MRDKAIEIDPFIFCFVPDNRKTQEMCIRAVEQSVGLLGYVPDWFVTQGKLKIWHDDNDYCNNNKLLEWYDGYQKRKT